MPRFDVYERLDGPGFLLDCQADLLRGLNTRFVVPLLPVAEAPVPAARLNPVFEIRGQGCVMVTQYASAVMLKEMGEHVCSLKSSDATIMAALDMLLSGF